VEKVILGEVRGILVASQSHYKMEGKKLLVIQPLEVEGGAEGSELVAIDTVDAGVGDRVLVVVEGRSAALAADRSESPVDAAVVGVVDALSLV